MNNWTVVFIIVGLLILVSIIAGVVMTNKAIKVTGDVLTLRGNEQEDKYFDYNPTMGFPESTIN